MTSSLESDISYQVVRIVRGTTVDGPGLRTSVYLAGCTHACPGCHNPQSHNPAAGFSMSLAEIMTIILEEGFDVTLTGGDPLYSPERIIPLMKAVREAGLGLWLYTGYTWEQIIASPLLRSAVQLADVVVDAPFDVSLRDTDLLFRGSSNQRLIRVAPSLSRSDVILY